MSTEKIVKTKFIKKFQKSQIPHTQSKYLYFAEMSVKQHVNNHLKPSSQALPVQAHFDELWLINLL